MNLTPAGERQAEAVAGWLAAKGLDAVQTSPRERTMQTAAVIGARADAPVEVVEALDEIDFGEWTGSAYDALEGQPAWRDWNERRGTARCPGGESMAEAADRISAHAQALCRTHSGARVALVSHADMLRGLVARVLGLPLDNMLRFEVAPASVSRVEIGDWGGRVLGLNETVQAEDE